MTRKDFRLIAHAITASKPVNKDAVHYAHGWAMYKLIVRNMAACIQEQHPNFDKEKFYAACGLE